MLYLYRMQQELISLFPFSVPQAQSYAHIPFVGADTARDVVTAMKAEKERGQQMKSTFLHQQARNTQHQKGQYPFFHPIFKQIVSVA